MTQSWVQISQIIGISLTQNLSTTKYTISTLNVFMEEQESIIVIFLPLHQDFRMLSINAQGHIKLHPKEELFFSPESCAERSIDVSTIQKVLFFPLYYRQTKITLKAPHLITDTWQWWGQGICFHCNISSHCTAIHRHDQHNLQTAIPIPVKANFAAARLADFLILKA